MGVEGSAILAPEHPGKNGRTLTQAVRRGALWSAASALTMRFANLAIMAVVARILSPRDFGVFAVAITVHVIVASIAELGVASCLMRGDVDPPQIAPTVATISLVTSSLLAGAMIIFAQPLSIALGSAEAAGPMRVMAIAVVLTGVFSVPSAELARNFRQDKQFLANMLGFIVGNSVLLLLAMNGGGAMSFAWSRVVYQLVLGSTMTVIVRGLYRPRMERRHLRYLLGFGLPLAGANLLNYALLNADYVIIGHLLGPVELGTYMIAFNISILSSSLLGYALNGVAMPAFSRVKHDPVLLQQAIVRATAALALIALPICGLTATLAHPLIRTVYGDKWDAAAPVLVILAFYGAISIVCLLFANVLVGLGHPRGLLLAQVPWVGALVPAMAIGVKVNSIVGAAVAHIVVVCAVALPVYLYMLKRSSIVRLAAVGRALLPPLGAAIVACAVAFVLSRAVTGDLLRLLAGGVAGGLCYLFLTFPRLQTTLGSRLLPQQLAVVAKWYQRVLERVGLGTRRRRRHAGA